MRCRLLVLTFSLMIGASQSAPVSGQTPDTNGVYRQGPGLSMPKLLHSAEPPYTELARTRNISGVARVQIIVDADGHIRSPQIVKSIADSYSDDADRAAALSLDQSASEVVTHYVFEPGTFNGKPVPIFMTIEVGFQLLSNGHAKNSDSHTTYSPTHGIPLTASAPAKAPDPHLIYSRGPGVVMPRLLQSYEPSFTEQARKRKITGQATVQFIVDENGQVRNARIIKSIADAYTSSKDRAAAQSLDQQAVDVVNHYVFAPGTFHDQPVSTSNIVEISFQVR